MRSLIVCSLLSISVLFAQGDNKAKADKKDRKKGNDNFRVIIQQGDGQQDLNVNIKELLKNRQGNKPMIIINYLDLTTEVLLPNNYINNK